MDRAASPAPLSPGRPTTLTAGPDMPAGDRIVAAALEELPPAGVILLEGCPLALGIARALPVGRDYTVVTNAVRTAAVLAHRSDITLLLMGGLCVPGTGATSGPADQWGRALREARVDLAFVSADGVSPGQGLYVRDPQEASAKRMMVAAARRTVVLADHTRIGRAHLARFAGLADVDCLVTDSGVGPGHLWELRDRVLRLVVV
ncbi:DeoR/GlpR family DNA-binding transcription regulator [Nocardiopsis sp. NPDC058631]|uniref:DeoR/GlpR family DNA-binding transcription regulator n=1 Tax=Nocardiopsis sp. NPDC058631 TaxID=3346566 RepID=UPI00365AE0C2